jgi:hypothetical protein
MASSNEVVVGGGDSPLRTFFHGCCNEHILCVYHLLARTNFFPQHNFPTWLLDVI